MAEPDHAQKSNCPAAAQAVCCAVFACHAAGADNAHCTTCLRLRAITVLSWHVLTNADSPLAAEHFRRLPEGPEQPAAGIFTDQHLRCVCGLLPAGPAAECSEAGRGYRLRSKTPGTLGCCHGYVVTACHPLVMIVVLSACVCVPLTTRLIMCAAFFLQLYPCIRQPRVAEAQRQH